jgi:hypothetical protein
MRINRFLAACSLMLLVSPLWGEFVIADNGKALVKIVGDQDASPVESFAVQELARYLSLIAGVTVPIITDATGEGGPVIAVGEKMSAAIVGPERALVLHRSEEEVRVKTFGKDLLIFGGSARGTLYAVYTFLEDAIGCHWWTSSDSTIPIKPRLAVNDQDVSHRPSFSYREPFWEDSQKFEFSIRNRCNGNYTEVREFEGLKTKYLGGFVHTFNDLIPVKEYYIKHPEWFSEINGKRIGAKGEVSQLCLSNPFLLREVIAKVLKIASGGPNGGIISVSQNDNELPCQCKKCLEIEKEEGSHSGPIIRFVNKIADSVKKIYSNVRIDTLAYQYSQQPPLKAVPAENVIVRLCDIDLDFSVPVTDKKNQKFHDDLLGWRDIGSKVYVWNYSTNFWHYLAPNPTIGPMMTDYRFFKEKGIEGIFDEGAFNGHGAEFSELRAWLQAQMLWDADKEPRALMMQFLEGYYGPAGKYLLEYIDLMQQEVQEHSYRITIFMPLCVEYLNNKLINKCIALFDQAETSVKADPVFSLRVKRARLPIDYIVLNTWSYGDYGFNSAVQYPAFAEKFFKLASEYGIGFVSEKERIAVFQKKTEHLAAISDKRALPGNFLVDAQDTCLAIAYLGTKADYVLDHRATDNSAIKVIADNNIWIVQLPLRGHAIDSSKRYRITIFARATSGDNRDVAFRAGIYDEVLKTGIAQTDFSCTSRAGPYGEYVFSYSGMNQDMVVWVAPSNSPKDSVLYIDRIAIGLE